MLPALALPALDLEEPLLVRVEDPDDPDALCRSETGSVLAEPPPAGTPWSWEPIGQPDAWESEAIEVLGVPPWRDLGGTGAGVKVAVFDVQWFSQPPERLGAYQTWDCWAHPSCSPPIDPLRPAFAWEVGVHGWGCAEVIHDIAPEAELHLVRVSGRTSLENAVAWAIREDIDLISMSLSYYNGSFYDGTGAVSELMATLREHGVLMVTSAGNLGRGHWRGPFHDGDLDGRADFEGGNGLWVELREGRAGSIYAAWDQYGLCGTTDLDLWVFDADGRVVARSEAVQDPTADQCSPVERVEARVEETGWYWIELHHRRGTTSHLRVDILAKDGRLYDNMPEGSIVDPAASPNVLAVGAVNVADYLRADVESFSSRGPTSAGLSKPDIAGPDGLSTTSYGPGGFYGTSAATPAVVGALAVILSAEPELSPWEAAERLQGWAWGVEPGRGDTDTALGAGKARLPAPAEDPGCGRRRLLLPLFLPPLLWFRRRSA